MKNKSSRYWQPLELGDIVDIVAPGFGLDQTQFKLVKKYVHSIGLVPRIQKGIFSKDLLCAASDEIRFEHLKNAVQNKDSKAVWCVRGGYGTIRLLPSLEKIRVPRRPKVLIGYSDITSLFLIANQKWNWASLHGPVLERLGSGRASRNETKVIGDILFGNNKELKFSNLTALNCAALKPNILKGKICGGNMTVLQSSLGTKWQIQGGKKFIFIEEIAEPAYKIDRFLHQMNQAGAWKNAAAVLIGNITQDCVQQKKLSWKVLQKYFEDWPIPVVKGLKVGHGQKQDPLPFNTKAEIQFGQKIQLKVESGFLS